MPTIPLERARAAERQNRSTPPPFRTHIAAEESATQPAGAVRRSYYTLYSVIVFYLHSAMKFRILSVSVCVSAVMIATILFWIFYSSPTEATATEACCACQSRNWTLNANTQPAPFSFVQQNFAGVGTFESRAPWRYREISDSCVTLGNWSNWSTASTMVLAAGHYEVEFDQPSAIVPVSVGDIFLTAGQSNSLAIGSWSVSGCSRLTHGGRVDVAGWTCGLEICTYDMLGDFFVEQHASPVAFVMTGVGGRAISAWDDGDVRARLFNALEWYKPRGVLWHQGESDAFTDMVVYEDKLSKLIVDAQDVVNATWIVAQVTGDTIPAQRSVAERLENVFIGPNTLETLSTPEYTPDDVHFTCEGTAVNARLWWQSIQAAGLDRRSK